MWEKLKRIKRFEEKEAIEELIGPAKFQVEDRPLFYYGNGILIDFVTRKFYIDDCDNTIEFGGEGLFALSVYHFSNVTFLKKYMHINKFDASDIIQNKDYIIDNYVNYTSRFADVRKAYKVTGGNEYYREGEKRTLSDGKFVFLNQFIQWEPFVFLFEEKTKSALLSGVVYTPVE